MGVLTEGHYDLDARALVQRNRGCPTCGVEMAKYRWEAQPIADQVRVDWECPNGHHWRVYYRMGGRGTDVDFGSVP